MSDRVGGRHGYWFPLVLLGFGLLGLLGWYVWPATDDFGWFAYVPQSPEFGLAEEQHLVGVDFGAVLTPGAQMAPARDSSWAVLVTVTLVATMAWYGWRARRAGGSVRPYVMSAVGGGVGVAVCYLVAGMASSVTDPAGLVTSVGLPLAGLGAVSGVWAYFQRRRVAAAVSVVCLVAGVGMMLGAWAPGLLDPLVITGGLLALARYERSRLLAVVAGVLLVVMLVFPDGPPSMLLPAVVLLGTAIIVLARQSRTIDLSGQ